MMRTVVLLLLALALAVGTASAGLLGEEWTRREIRGQVELGEIVWPVFGEKGGVDGGARLMIGLAWRALDPAELEADPDDDGVKTLGLFGGLSFDITDPFNQKWVQFTGGMTVEEIISIGMAMWVGNATETAIDESTGAETTVAVPGLDTKLKTVFGLGLDANPD